MSIIGLIAYVAISIFIIIMWVRFAFDFVMSINRGWRPRGLALIIAEIAFTVTDPPVKLVRRLVPPMRVGNMALDFGWAIVLITAIILSYLVLTFL